ncbi:hypothetical protein A3G06_01445 [Candidatus Nomurabacteria bacterium RIFCSPLOWO2_12_FULL_46_14]|uniref:RNA polymerase sigma factor 70 region 4 type 2 domain-containing protein n=1 Tax=Candidatus Nomurabacteria bacterium RIFCSPLOWO2_12_FULL_46_14 TaxID=1801797 RepID=A0A1F6YAI7_9BACT|nr:MAG: hypothetical protein A3G06_01445 [Candidatus Nomurabacteria bacterium RIFCSPLOWO2_12_FULL_46_14]
MNLEEPKGKNPPETTTRTLPTGWAKVINETFQVEEGGREDLILERVNIMKAFEKLLKVNPYWVDILIHRLEGSSHQKIAERFNLPKYKIRNDLERARNRLFDFMGVEFDFERRDPFYAILRDKLL